MTTYKDHPLAAIFPLMEAAELAELAEDILQNTQRAPITLYENKILDGRNRYRACLKVNVEPKVRHFTSGDPQRFVISANLKRKHYNESQRAIIAAKLTGVESNGSKPNSALMRTSRITTKAAAEELNVSTRSVETAQKVIREAPRKVVKQIASGAAKLVTAAKELKKTKAAPVDKIGCAIPADILTDWREAESFDDLLRQIHRIKLRVDKALDEKELAFREITNSTVADLHNAWSALQGLIPFAVCPTCEGHNRQSCTLCKQRGFLSKFAYEHYVPKKARELREKLHAA